MINLWQSIQLLIDLMYSCPTFVEFMICVVYEFVICVVYELMICVVYELLCVVYEFVICVVYEFMICVVYEFMICVVYEFMICLCMDLWYVICIINCVVGGIVWRRFASIQGARFRSPLTPTDIRGCLSLHLAICLKSY